MKRPLLDEIDRAVIREMDCLYRTQLLIYIAKVRLKRDFKREILDNVQTFLKRFKMRNKDIVPKQDRYVYPKK